MRTLPISHGSRTFLAAATAFILALAMAIAWPSRAAGAPGGGRLWVARYDGPVTGFDAAAGMAVSADGARLYVGGSSTGSGNDYDYAVVRYKAATGAMVWVVRYDGLGKGDDYGNALGLSGNGRTVFITGGSVGRGGDWDYATVAYDATTGAKLWVSRFNSTPGGDDFGLRLAVSPDGSSVYVTGRSGPVPDHADFVTIAYDSKTGAQLWLRRYASPGGVNEWPNAIAASSDGKAVFVAGQSEDPIHMHYRTIAYDAVTGARLWASRYQGSLATSLVVSPDASRVYVTGERYTGDMTLDDYATVAYDAATGAKVWARWYNGPDSSYDLAFSVAVSPDGAAVYVTGTSGGPAGTNYDYATVAYDAATGKQTWATRYDGPAGDQDEGASVAVSPDGDTVFVTGDSRSVANDLDYATLAYDAETGAQVWLSRYDGTGHGADWGSVVLPSPDGSTVFVTGHSKGTGSWADYDYATIAYRPT